MRAAFHDDAHIRTSWYDGGADDYIVATRERMAVKSPTSKHWVFPAGLSVAGDRATVESPAMIFDRVRLDGVEVDFHVFCRFFSRVVRRDDDWRLASFEVLFERDVLRAVNPADVLPVDWAVLATYRPSYRFLTWIQESRGTRVNPDLYGDDRRFQPEAADEGAGVLGHDRVFLFGRRVPQAPGGGLGGCGSLHGINQVMDSQGEPDRVGRFDPFGTGKMRGGRHEEDP
jgi:hypothetical protein